MADKNYNLIFTLSDGTKKCVQFTAPQGEKGDSASGCSKTVLWQNDSPTSKFSSQTIALPLDDYDAVEIIYSMSTFAAMNRFATTGELPVFSGNITVATLDLESNHTAEIWLRNNSAEITMGDRESNIPYLIYGIKR